MQQAIAEQRIEDTPSASRYREYDERKRELWLKYGPGEDYDQALTELIDELGI